MKDTQEWGMTHFSIIQNMGTLSRSNSRASCPALESTSQARKGWPRGIKLRQLRREEG